MGVVRLVMYVYRPINVFGVEHPCTVGKLTRSRAAGHFYSPP